MAPLLGRKPFPLVKPLPGEEPLYTIAHTQEAFRTREYPFPRRAGPEARGRGGESRGLRWVRAGSCQREGWPVGLHPAPAGPGRMSRRASRQPPNPASFRPAPPHFVPGAPLSRRDPSASPHARFGLLSAG